MKKIIQWLAIGVALLALAIQVIPYGRNHDNPPVLAEPNWDTPRTRELAVRACYDCHSNESDWPWYSNIAPLSWLIQRDVDEGRESLNFSEWGSREFELDEIAEVIEEGEMPPQVYLIQHPEARLTPAEMEDLVVGFSKSLR